MSSPSRGIGGSNFTIMKKILLFIAAAASLAGCSKGSGDDVAVPAACPVTNLVLPASGAENPIEPGTTVTIRGNGFTAGSEIWLGTSADTEVRAEVTQTTEEGIVFTAPETIGEQHVILRQEGGTWDLGTLYFGTKSSGSDEGEQENPSDEGEQENPSDEGGQENPSDEGGQEEDDTVAKPKISEIYSSFYKATFDYFYDKEDRVTEIRIYYTTDDGAKGYAKIKIERFQNRICVIDDMWDEYSEFTIVDGRVKESECSKRANGKPMYSLEYFYDENGYLEKKQKTDDDYFMYSYDDGSLESILTIDKALSSSSHSQERVDIIPNRSVPNNLNLDFFALQLLHRDEICYNEYLLNIVGRRMKYMPEQIIFDGSPMILEYEFDGDLVSVIHYTIHSETGKVLTDGFLELTYE